ncbi:putative Ricin B lectin domain-containing protein [Seiridium cardinale]|uniref:Ricin B lectin domain-containing protein n=1 Tax=Seiridium cardinale TaxID=138064 RepID=A0ABR2Y203_9PEZI
MVCFRDYLGGNASIISILLLTLATAGLAQTIPPGYRAVYITSTVDAKHVVVPKAASSGSTVVVKPEQQWYIQSGNTTIQLAGTSLCLDVGAQSNWKDMASISLATCSVTVPGQQWVAMTDGRIALGASSPR